MIEGSDRPFALGVGRPANTLNDGTSLHKDDTVAPYEISFRTPQAVKERLSSERPAEWWKPIQENVKEGDVIYELWAVTPAVDHWYQ